MEKLKTIGIVVCAAFFVAAYFAPALADEDNWSTSGPHDASIYSIAIHPFDNQRIFIGTLENFVYETTDGGGEWSLLGDTLDGYPSSTQVRVLKIHPFGPDTMFAATTRGVYESTDAGQNWSKIMSLPYPDVQYWSLEINRENPPVIFVGHMSAALRSTDGGRSWQEMSPIPGQPKPIVADPVRPNIIYSGANTTIEDATIWKSTDSGLTWQNIHNNMTFGHPDDFVFALSIGVDPVDPEIVYFGRSCRYITDPPGALMKSTNGGEYWVDITPPDLHKNRIHGVTVSPVDHNTVFVGTDANGLLRSLDGGLSWEEINQGIVGINPRAQTVAVDSVTGIIYLGRHSSGIYRSIDNGDSWEKISYNITGAGCTDIAANWRDPDTLYTTTGNGLYMSIDGADSWEYIDISFPSAWPSVNKVEVDPFDPSYVYVGYYGTDDGGLYMSALYRSTDGGASWESFTQGLPADKLPVEISIADYGGGVRRLFMATNAGLYFSDDLGESWSLCGGGLPITYFRSLDVSPANPDLVFAGDTSPNLYKSSDGGETWELLDSLPYDDWVRAIVCDPVDPDIVYINMVGRYPGFHGILKSTDGGQRWQDISNNLPRSSYFYTSGIAINPYNNNNVFVYSSGRGIFQSHDGGQFWEDFNDGLRVWHGYAYTLIDPTDTSRVFMAWTSVWEITRTTQGGDCAYIPGDCDHNGTALELADVIAMIGMYRGSVEPYYVCDCPPHGDTFAAEADPNGNCTPDELSDVVQEIGAYRGDVEASGCDDCPGSLRLAPADDHIAIPSLKSRVKAGLSQDQ